MTAAAILLKVIILKTLMKSKSVYGNFTAIMKSKSVSSNTVLLHVHYVFGVLY